jgi:DNA adenine methylase
MSKKLNIFQNINKPNKIYNITNSNMINDDLATDLAELVELEQIQKGDNKKIIIVEDKKEVVPDNKTVVKKGVIKKVETIKTHNNIKIIDDEQEIIPDKNTIVKQKSNIKIIENNKEEKKEIPIIKQKKNKNTTTDNKSLKPIVKWSGGKSDEIKNFQSHIPKDYEIYLEPFIGGGSVFFSENPKKAVISDVHKELIDLYNSIKDGNSNDIYNFMETHDNDETIYYEVRDKMEHKTVLDNAKRFYYLRKTCFRGMLRYNKSGGFNIPFGKYKQINYEDLKNKNYEDLLKRTTILNKSFEYIFENYNSEKNFMFLDPPYDSEFTDYGYCQFGKKEQEKLAECFKNTKIRCLMIIGKTNLISELYKDYIVGEYKKNYRFKLYAGRIGDEINTTHLIIKNFK